MFCMKHQLRTPSLIFGDHPGVNARMAGERLSAKISHPEKQSKRTREANKLDLGDQYKNCTFREKCETEHMPGATKGLSLKDIWLTSKFALFRSKPAYFLEQKHVRKTLLTKED